ncbi:GntR family transcriptional regulator [Castellaniella caeni]|uniref:GntR family transcriptional regulator n=1 Tax=Castellaniella caeni TaxID=266123 RepID=UPI000C9FF8D1|nr:GntR family transcriptional regulator [Castellaniella caeni]
MTTSPLPSAQTLENLSIPRYERVRIAIQQRLAQQAWGVDQPIPTEQEFAREYGVSIGTVRKAIERLVADGLLVKRQGSGTFLRRPDFSHSLLRFFRLRDAAGQPVLPVGVVKQVALVAGDAVINQKLQQPEDARLVHLTRIRLVENSVVLSERIWLPAALFAALVEVPAARFGNLLYPFFEETCQQRVFSVEETLSVSCDCTDAYLGVRPPDPVVCIERVAHDLVGQPLEYRKSYGLPQHFRYQVKIH